MNRLAALPTRREEDWRYADEDVLAGIGLAAINERRTIEVGAGERRQEWLGLFPDRQVATCVDRLQVSVAAGGTFELFAINAASAYGRIEAEVTLAEGAHFRFGGVTIGGGEAVQEFVTRVIHAEPGASSQQVVRAVHWGRATGNFLGRVEVARDAQKSDAAQNFKAILLEDGASANTKPELEIFADDVRCAHGAAIGALDDKAAFYMAARGIPPEIARKLLVRAFVADAFSGIEGETLREDMLESALSVLREEVI